MSDIALARAELVALLTPIAPVRTGRNALETTSAPLPVIVLWSNEDRPVEQQEQGYMASAYTRPINLEYQCTASAAYDDDLDAVLRSVRLALKPRIGGSPLPHAVAVRETGARFPAPALSQGGSVIAVLQINLEIDYLERL